MECNRDEAIRARDIAEGKFAMQDFLGAKKFILKAQQLYPPLEGAAQMLAVLDVHIAAQVKVGINETDWYGILQVEPASDDSTIKKQYRRLALLLHPDKNPAKGAEAAFKLLGEAFGVLSDSQKRYVHDSKRGAQPRVAQPASHASEPSKPGNAAYQAQYQAAAAHATPAANGPQAPHSSLTFWTACPICRMQYQYMRTYLGYQLLCQKCHKPFLANDINAPAANGTTTFTWNNGPFPTGPVPPAPRRAGTFNFQTWPQNGGVAPGSVPANGHARGPGAAHTAGAGNHPSGSTAGAGASAAATAAAANLVQEAYQRAQRDRVVAEKAEVRRRAKDDEKLARQQEKEAIKKARDAAKTQEALQKLTKKREEAIEKETRRKAAMRTGTRRRLKKRRREDDDDEDDEDEEAEDLETYNPGYGRQADLTRKSSRHRRSVAYGIDGEPSDDDDFEILPVAKKSRATANGGDVGHDSRMEKGKSVMYDEGEVFGAGVGSGNKVAPVRDNRAKDPLMEKLGDKFKRDILVNLVAQVRQSTQAPITKFMGDRRQTASKASGDTHSVQHVGISSVSNGRGDQKNDEVNVAGEGGTPDGESEEEQIVVPNPDFHDFDADRTEIHVKKNQVWAVFDETDGMPRFYCQINKVTRAPFFVEGVWLEPIHPQKNILTWLKSRELSIGSGEFRLGDEFEFDSINMFSHLMGNTKKSSRNSKLYEVYPKKPEVWAIYADYEKETSNNAEGKLKLRYDFVLIRSDFSAMTGQGRVAKLQKLKGYKTLWIPDREDKEMLVKYDLHKFSHRVPALTVTEKDVQGVPCECLELDPASTPADVIQN